MVISVLCAASIVVLVALSIFRGSRTVTEQKFPWFWVFFPLTIFSIAGLVGSIISDSSVAYNFGWTMYTPLSDAIEIPIWDSIFSLDMIVLLLVSIGGAIGSVLSWRRGRI